MANIISDRKFEEVCAILALQVKVTNTLRKVLRSALNEVGLGDVPAGSGDKATKVRGKNGYNLYYSQRNAELKATVSDGDTRRKQITGEWKSLSDEIKAEWAQKALALGSPTLEPVSPPLHPTKEKKISGWNLFVKAKMTDEEFKKQYPDHTARMKAIGPIWKEMTKEEKDTWNAKVKALLGAPKGEVPAPVVEVPRVEVPAPVPVVEAPVPVVEAPAPVVEAPKVEASKKKRVSKKAPVVNA